MPIIFLHGGPGLYTEERRFDEGAVFRKAGFTTIYFDQAGGGQSKQLPATAYSLDRAVLDLEALRVALGHERIILWGNSYGAALAAVYTARYSTRVAGMILTSPGMFPGFEGKRDYSGTARDKVEYSKAVRDAVALIDREGGKAEQTLSQDTAGKLFDELASSELIDGVICKGSKTKPAPLPGGGNLYAQRLLFRDVKALRFAPPPRSDIPTLIIRGSCDFIPRESALRYQAAFGGKLVDIADSGHGLLENREQVDAALADFARTRLPNAAPAAK